MRSENIECTDNNVTATGYSGQTIAYLNGWYNTCLSYSNATHTGGELFTKTVWKATTNVACAWSPASNEVNNDSQCASRYKFACLYHPPGNAEGDNATEEYRQNVQVGCCLA